MAKVFMCDRCGVYRTDGSYNHRHDITIEVSHEETNIITTYELCSNCSRAFGEFVSNRPTEGK